MLLTRILWVVSLLSCIVYMVVVYPQLPEQIPTHFNASGEPDAWGSKDSAIGLLGIVIIAMNIFLGLFFTLFMSKIPESIINIPWKDYWFASAQRKAMAHERLKLVIAGSMVFVNAVMLMVLYMTVEKSLRPQEENSFISAFLFITIALVIVFLGWIFYVVKPPKDAAI